jgi:hypothetical protein
VSYTYAVLEVTQTTYDEIAKKLRDAGYGHAFETVREATVGGTLAPAEIIDMHGIALRASNPELTGQR